jgi:hypothetical protein
MRGGAQWSYGVSSFDTRRHACRTDQQFQGILAGLSITANLFFLRETRGDVLLSRRAKRLTKITGKRHCCASDLQKKSFTNLLRVSLVRPFGMYSPHVSQSGSGCGALTYGSVPRYRAYCHCPVCLDRLCVVLSILVGRINPTGIWPIWLEHRSTRIYPSVSLVFSYLSLPK